MSSSSSRKSMKELQEQLQALQAEIETRRQNSLLDLRLEFDTKLAEYDLTLLDVYPELAKGISRKREKSPKAKAVIAPKYANPHTGEKWVGGKGPVPKWVKVICQEKGITVERFKEMPEFSNQ
jgi:DNA-binding protein H-NS